MIMEILVCILHTVKIIMLDILGLYLTGPYTIALRRRLLMSYYTYYALVCVGQGQTIHYYTKVNVNALMDTPTLLPFMTQTLPLVYESLIIAFSSHL
jgi:hypothetical protein